MHTHNQTLHEDEQQNGTATDRPSVDDNEGLRLRVELALLDGFRPAGLDVAHIIVGDVGRAQGELGDDVGVVCDPLSGGRQGSGGGVSRCSAHTNMMM